ncbi:MAG: xanthine phosphoribosyltransferase [Bacilli bacterium]|nr:xanthine phosphoribosyltransferase [Bacilli bacterium]
MKSIEKKILEEGRVLDNEILKVDSFLNHQIDPKVINEFAKEVANQFRKEGINKVLTIETSGIAIAYAVAEALGNIPLVFAKKTKSKIVDDDVFKADVKSFTRGTVSPVSVSKKYLSKEDKILLVDDFLAEGCSALGLLNICSQAGAEVKGLAIVIEKIFQGGRELLENKGVKVFAGASIKAFVNNSPVF